MKKTYSLDLMKSMAIFDKLMSVPLKDCFEMNDVLYFVVPENMIGKALGANGKNLHRLKAKFPRKLRIIEYREKPEEFIQSVVHPLKVKAREENNVIIMHAQESRQRGILIGRNAQNLRSFESILKRFFPIDELKVE